MWLMHDIHLKEVPKSALFFLWYVTYILSFLIYFNSLIVYILKLNVGKYENPGPGDVGMLTNTVFLKGL